MTVLLDTNVLISAILFGGKPREILRAAIAGKLKLFLSEPILKELQEVLEEKKFAFSSSYVSVVVSELVVIAEVIESAQKIDFISSDPSDNRVLECGLAGRASIIVSGDKHLLQIGSFQGIPILSPAQFTLRFPN